LEDSGNRSDAAVSYSLAVKHYPHPMYRGFLSRLVRPKTIDDFPELLAQQERLRQQRELNHFGTLSPNPVLPDGFGNPISPMPQLNDPFNTFHQPNNHSPFLNGVPGR
jgi:hypothetical protein